MDEQTNKVKLPEGMNYAEAYLTFRCDLGCGYCINKAGEFDKDIVELSGESWIRGLNRIDFGDTPIVLGGGEPTKHKDFYEIVRGISPRTRVDLLTNLTFDVDEFIDNVNRFKDGDGAYKRIRASYHAQRHKPEELIRKAVRLQEEGFSIGLFGINHPDSVVPNMRMAELARKNQIYFFVKDFLGMHKGEMHGHYRYPQGVLGESDMAFCRSNELLISPSGNYHRCHRELYNGSNSVGRLGDEIVYEFSLCDRFGKCNPCDVKLKTNRFLQMGYSSVEIKKTTARPAEDKCHA